MRPREGGDDDSRATRVVPSQPQQGPQPGGSGRAAGQGGPRSGSGGSGFVQPGFLGQPAPGYGQQARSSSPRSGARPRTQAPQHRRHRQSPQHPGTAVAAVPAGAGYAPGPSPQPGPGAQAPVRPSPGGHDGEGGETRRIDRNDINSGFAPPSTFGQPQSQPQSPARRARRSRASRPHTASRRSRPRPTAPAASPATAPRRTRAPTASSPRPSRRATSSRPTGSSRPTASRPTASAGLRPAARLRAAAAGLRAAAGVRAAGLRPAGCAYPAQPAKRRAPHGPDRRRWPWSSRSSSSR